MLYQIGLENRIPVNTSLDNIFLKLHWLRVRFRIIYKVLVMVHNCLHGNAPAGVSAMVIHSKAGRTLKLQETRSLSSYGDRAFSHVAPKLWNLLPTFISVVADAAEFRTNLKTFLMTRGDEFIA